MTTCKDIVEYFEHLAPGKFAEEWDNVGLLIGNTNKIIDRMLVCLDVTSTIVDVAINNQVDMIISHHPFIFKKLDRILENELKGNLIYKLVKNDICVFCAHTNLDVTQNGVNMALAEILDLKDIERLKGDNTFYNDENYFGLGAVGNLENAMTMNEFASHVKDRLNAGFIRIIGARNDSIRRIAVFCGSFDEDFNSVKFHDADVLITGDVKYHTATDAIGLGICTIDAGHFNTEKVILPKLAAVITKKYPEITIISNNMEHDPFKSY